MELTLAEALLRRKELAGLVDSRKTINKQELFTPVGKRVKVTDSIDDLAIQVPRLTASQVMSEYDFYAKQLRKIDALIQQANWTCKVNTGNDDLMADFDPTKVPAAEMVPIKDAMSGSAARTIAD